MKKFELYILLSCLCASVISCAKHQDYSEPSGTHKVFSAVIEDRNTKTTIDGNKVKWIANDQIYIEDSSNNAAIYQADNGGEKTTSFTFVSGDEPENTPFSAYYPATLKTNDGFKIPETQQYNPNSPFCVTPMYAQSENTSLSFCNLCGILKISVDKTVCSSVSSLVIQTDSKINGSFEVVETGDGAHYKAQLIDDTDATKIQILECSEPVVIGETPKDFYFAIPTGNYTNIKIAVVDGNNNPYFMVTTKDKEINIDRNTVYPITFNSNMGDEGQATEYKFGMIGVVTTKGDHRFIQGVDNSICIPITLKNKDYVSAAQFNLTFDNTIFKNPSYKSGMKTTHKNPEINTARSFNNSIGDASALSFTKSKDDKSTVTYNLASTGDGDFVNSNGDGLLANVYIASRDADLKKGIYEFIINDISLKSTPDGEVSETHEGGSYRMCILVK